MQWTGAEIKRRRIDKGLTQQELADLIGRSRSIVVDWEAGSKEPGARSIRSLEEVLGDTRSDTTLLQNATFMQTLAHLADLYANLEGQVGALRADPERFPGVTDGPPERYRWRTADAPTARRSRKPDEGLDQGEGQA